MMWRRIAIWGVLGLVLAAGLVYAFRPQPVAVDLAATSRGPMRVTIDDEGETRVKEVYVVSAPVAGTLQRIEIHVGDPVIAGETVLTTIEPTVPAFLDVRSEAEAKSRIKAAEAALALAEAAVARAEAELDFALAEHERARALAARETISKRALDRADLDVATRRAVLAEAKAALEVKRYELGTARAALITPVFEATPDLQAPACCVPVRAPVQGRVLMLLQESEAVVAAGTPLVEIGDPRDLEVVVDLLSSDAVRVREGAEVSIEEWGGDAALKGRVHRVEPYGFTKISALGVEEKRVNVIVDFEDPPERRPNLGHGYRVEARITVWQADDVVRLPLSALFREGGEWSVFAAAEGRARLVRVTVGHLNDREAEVLEGLEAGTQVVLHPSDRIGDGTLIVPRG